MVKTILLFCGILLAMAAAPAGAQGDPWAVWLYDGTQILIVGAEGITDTIALPDEARRINTVADRPVALSPDQQTLAFSRATFDSEGFTSTLYLADLASGNCCLTIDNPFTRDSTYIQPGPFSPDNAQVFVAATRWLADTETYESAFLILDAQTGEIRQQVEPGALWGGDNNTTRLPEWTGDGLLLYPDCIPCEGRVESAAWLWNPDTGEAQPTDRYYVSAGDRLPLTGEYIYPAQDPNYPAASGNFPMPYNVVKYRDDGTTSSEPVVIYHDSSAYVPAPVWVLDGAAYLLSAPSNDTAMLIHRDGSTEIIAQGPDQILLAGTPDGWLSWGAQDHGLYAYARDADGNIHAEQIGTSDNLVQVLARPRLGASVIDEPLVPVTSR